LATNVFMAGSAPACMLDETAARTAAVCEARCLRDVKAIVNVPKEINA
jgi:hypothetical protein